MKKFLLLILVAMTAFGVNAQTRKGEGSLMGSLGYQTNYAVSYTHLTLPTN